MQQNHSSQELPTAWVQKYSPLISPEGRVLDLACGAGRHTRWLLAAGHPVLAVDKDTSRFGDLAGNPNLEILEADLEAGGVFPLKGQQFSGIIVVNYLYRPLLPRLIEILAVGGVLIYQTFMRGNEKYGRPRNPDFLLKENELTTVFGQALDVIAFEQGLESHPTSAMRQKICAIKK